jgi:RimJ/RimL family protein N-acetyltransferase
MMGIYERAPAFESDHFLLRPVASGDAADLLAVYADPAVQGVLEACSAWNCMVYGYGAKTLADMEACIDFWQEEYKKKYYIRFAIVDKGRGVAVGTAEMYQREAGGFGGGMLCLRLDLCSAYETEPCIGELLGLSAADAAPAFGARGVFTRATSVASERIRALQHQGFARSGLSLPDGHGWGVVYGDFWVKNNA